MIFRIENLEINTKGVFKALVLTGIGINLYRAVRSPRIYVNCYELNNQKKDKNESKKETKVESK